MKAGFALLLSHDGLVLCHRAADGWLKIGSVALDAQDVPGQLAALRAEAIEIAKARGLAPMRTKLVLPNSEILYDTISVEGTTGPDYDAVIRDKLDGRTPYAVDELCYDYVVTKGSAQVAVVARETLEEAEAFAVEHKFAPVCFAAIPTKGAFSGEPMFGTTKAAARLLRDGETLERDMAPVVIVGEVSDAPPKAPASAPPKGPAGDTQTTGPSFSSARARAATVAPPGKDAVPAPAKLDGVASRITIPEAPSPDAAPAVPTAAMPASPPPKANPKSRPAGLILTICLLVMLVVVGALAVVFGGSETAMQEQDRQDAQPVDAVAEAPAAVPSPTVPPAPTGVPVIAMTEDPVRVPLPRMQQADIFAATPLPEEIAEGEEASVETAALPAPRLDLPDAPLQNAPVAPAPAPTAERPGLIETETRYAATGIWQRSPDAPPLVASTDIADLYIASLDRDIGIEDALALPVYRDELDLRPITPRPPVAPGTLFELDAAGFVEATEGGALTPEGVLVFTGADERPARRPLVTPATTEQDLERAALAEVRPPRRPGNLGELQERVALAGRSREELAALNPTPRPESFQEIAARETGTEDEAAESAMTVSLMPSRRPSDFAETVAQIRAARTEETAVASAGRTSGSASLVAAAAAPQSPPTIPTTASVARQATIENALRLNRINLVGVYGSSNSRRALVRLASGRYVKVEVGDRIDGGRVAAIGEDSLQYTKSGRNITLSMPRG